MDRIFYVIRCGKSDIGFFGLYNTVVYHIRIALSKGAEPVVDWCHYPNDYISEDDLVGKENAWEDFFIQPSGISLEEVYHSKNVIMSSGETRPDLGELLNPAMIEESQKITAKYVVMNERTKKICEDEYCRLKMDRSKVLGVKCRGTDFAATKPSGHSICPDALQTINIIENMKKSWGEYDYIFIATEDEEMFNLFKNNYGTKLICNQTERINVTNGKWLNELFDTYYGKKHCKKDGMMEYLISVYLLSRCNSLIAPGVGATLGAMLMKNEPYEHLHLIQMDSYE